MKKIYRSLFDSDDVFEVEEINDNPDISTSEVAPVKQDSGDAEKVGHTIEDCWNAIQKLSDAILNSPKGMADNEPAKSNEVAPQKVDIDKSKSVNDDEEIIEEEKEVVHDAEEDEDEKKAEEASKEVKDAYLKFANVVNPVKEDSVTATQVAFQTRYDKVANKG